MNALTRFKLALTEDNPTIRPYLEHRWAELIDSKSDDLSYSLMLLQGLHKRWAMLLESLNEKDLQRTFVHPEHGQTFTLSDTVGMYIVITI
ncbi:MAG: DinB family protein [Bacteroidota bacterium]